MSKHQTATIDFHGQPLVVITDDAQHLVAMKPVCEGIGLAWHGQFERIRRDEVLSTCVRVIRMQLPGDTQQREVVCLPIDYLNGWLFGIDVNRCREEIRPALIHYKRECYAALAAYWQEKEVEYTPSLIHRRWLMAFDNEGKEQITPVPEGAYVMTCAKLMAYIASGDSMISTEDLFDFVITATATLKRKNAWQARQLGKLR